MVVVGGYVFHFVYLRISRLPTRHNETSGKIFGLQFRQDGETESHIRAKIKG